MRRFIIFTCALLLFAFPGAVLGKNKQIRRAVSQVLEINSTTIQNHADQFFSLLTGWVDEPSNREDIVKYLSQFKELAYSIHLPTIRRAALSIAEEFFDVVERLRIRTRETLLAVSEIRISNLNHSFVTEAQEKFSDLETFVEKEISLLKDKATCRLAKVFYEHYQMLSNDGQLDHLQKFGSLYDWAFGHIRFYYITILRKAQDGTGIVSLFQDISSANATQSLEREIRSLSRELAANLEGIQVGFFRTLTKDYIHYLYQSLYDIRGELLILADRALEAHNRELQRQAFAHNRTNETFSNSSTESRGLAFVLNGRLESLRQGFGERLVAFRENTIAQLTRIVRNSVNAAGLRNIPELNNQNFYSAVSSIFRQIRGNVQRLTSAIRELYYEEVFRGYN